MIDKPDFEKVKALIADESELGNRIDAFIAKYMPPHVSRTRIKDIIKQEGVELNDERCTSPNYRLKEGDRIVIQIPPPEEALPEPQNIPLDIYFEDEFLLMVNKPAGMVVHPAIGHPKDTLVNALLHHCNGTLAGIGGVKRPGIVHRLDKETSGLLVVAKNDETYMGLQAQFADHGRTGPLKRNYQALVWGQFERKTGTINAHLGRSNSNRKKRAVVKEDNYEAKEAITHFTVQTEKGVDDNGEAIVSLVECRLETGRTHQIRVHMSHINHPLIGDQEYGKHFQTKENTLSDATREVVESFKRQALHAAVLGFEHPITKEYIHQEAPLPDDMARLIDAFDL